MKSFSLLSFLAITIPHTLSEPRAAATDNTPETAHLHSRANLVPFACHKANTIISDQLAEISQLQSRNLPVPPDLAGYLFAVYHGRDMLGCPGMPLLGSADSSSSASAQSKRSSEDVNLPPPTKGHLPGWGDPCEVSKILRVQVMEQINVLKDNNVPIPAYLAGWYSVTEDADKNLKCGFEGAAMENETNSTSSGQSSQ